MTSVERRQQIYAMLRAADRPLSAATLAGQCGVTRQVIVGDIALLRAEGHNIAATPRGYVIPAENTGLIRCVACSHSLEGTREELHAMVDCGCTVLDVIVEHPVYGQLTAALQLSSRYDVEQFISKMRNSSAAPLSALTEGIHLHTLSCPSEDAFAHLKVKLEQMGVLLPEQTD